MPKATSLIPGELPPPTLAAARSFERILFFSEFLLDGGSGSRDAEGDVAEAPPDGR